MSDSLEADIDAIEAEHAHYKQQYRFHREAREALIKAYYHSGHTLAQTVERFSSTPLYIQKVLGLVTRQRDTEEDAPLNLS